MMVVVGFLRLSGFFQRLTHWALRRIKTPAGLLAVTTILSGVLSAFLINDIVCLAMTPLVLHLARKAALRPGAAPDRPGHGRQHRLDRHHHRQSAEHLYRLALRHLLPALRASV